MKHDHNPKLLVARGYDRIAKELLRQHQASAWGRRREYLERLVDTLPDGAWVLDLGCGPGIPHTEWLSRRFSAVGVDISRAQLALARQHVPGATFVLADMCSLQFQPASFDAIAAMYSIIHVPREQHEGLLRNLFDFLKPGGCLFVVLGAGAWEGSEDDWLGLGAEMWWSHFDAETGLDLLASAGFRPVVSQIEPDNLSGGAHLFVLAEKPR